MLAAIRKELGIIEESKIGFTKIGTGGFLEYKTIISTNVVKQEELNSCAAACIKQLAKDFGKELTESEIRTLARTTDLGTEPKGIVDALIEIFGIENIEARNMIPLDNNDIKMVIEACGDNNPWIAWISPNPMGKQHAIIVDKIIGKNVYIRDTWPLGAIDAETFSKLDNGVEAIVDIEEFAKQWACGYNFMFKVKK